MGRCHRALGGGEGRTGTGFAPVALDACHQSGLFAADEGAGAQTQLDIKGEVCAQNVLAQQAVLTGLFDGDLQTVDGDGVLGPDIDVALSAAHGVGGDGHGLQHGEGVALQHGAVHEGAGVTLVGVTGHILDTIGADGVPGELPLQAGGEAGATPAPKAGILDGVDDLLGVHLVFQDVAQGHIAVGADVLVNGLGVDDAAVTQGDTGLVLIELGLTEGGDGVTPVALHVEQALYHTAFDEMLLHDVGNVRRGHPAVTGAVGEDHDDGAGGAEAEAAGFDDLDLLIFLSLIPK